MHYTIKNYFDLLTYTPNKYIFAILITTSNASL